MSEHAPFTREFWPLGWTPTADANNGNPEGLLRMQNLQPDEDGVLSLVRGTRKICASEFSGNIHSCYSKFFVDRKHRFVALSDGSVSVSSDEFANSTNVIAAGEGSSDVARFAAMFGEVIVSSGTKKKKYNGTDVRLLGVDPPTDFLGLGSINQPFIELSALSGGNFDPGQWSILLGTDLSFTGPAISFKSDTTVYDAIVQAIYSSPIDTTIFTQDGNDIQQANTDEIYLRMRCDDTSRLASVEIQFYLEDSSTATNFFRYKWVHDSGDPLTKIPEGQNIWFDLFALKREFTREGSDSTLDWSDVTAVKITFTGVDQTPEDIATWGIIPIEYAVTAIRVIGSVQGPLNGRYSYVQIDVNNTGSYQGKSVGSELPELAIVRNASITVSPATVMDEQVNEVWIFRRNIDTQDAWYRVLVITRDGDGIFQPTLDSMSDSDAQILNIKYNLYLKSVKDDLTDEIQGILTDVFGRVLYLTKDSIYVSDYLDLDTFDPRYTIKLSGNSSEQNLWITKSGEGSIYVGTTSDIYVLSGSFSPLPDGVLDAVIRPIGLEHPPISENFINTEGNILYNSDDGWRLVSGNHSESVVPQLKLLFEGYTRHGLSPVNIQPLNTIKYPCAFARNKFWSVMTLQDSSKAMFVFDFLKKTWHEQTLTPLCLFTEEDGILIGGFASGNAFLRELDYGSTIDGISGQSIIFQTVYDCNSQPRNRKDTFTFKLSADSGNLPITVYIAKDGGNWVNLGSIAFNGINERLFPLANRVGLGKSFAVKITGSGLSTLKLYKFSIEYDARPEQNVFLRIPYTNLGTTSRKRFVNYAFVIDTLGNELTFTPLIDGEIKTPSTLVMNRKGTYIHYFDEEQVGTDIGGLLECDIFEFYGVALDEIISEKMPTPTTFLVIPQSDFGTPNRKRHSSYKFVINTKGQDVRFTPRIDGVDYLPGTYNTSEKQVVEYFFPIDTIGINIGGTLGSISNPKTPFEFYGPIIPQNIEVLPPRLTEFRIPENNYGIAARKRIRTMPMEINTNGHDVIFTPIVDGVQQTGTIINTATRSTAFHYFMTDVFGIDFSGELTGGYPFEFYGLMKPEEVEVLPVAKKFDQVGPVELAKIGKLYKMRVRMFSTGALIPYTIYAEDEAIHTSSFVTTPNKAEVYEIPIPKSIRTTVVRIELGPTNDIFHRYYVKLLVNLSGMQSDNKWVELK